MTKLEAENKALREEMSKMREQNLILTQQAGASAALESHGYF